MGLLISFGVFLAAIVCFFLFVFLLVAFFLLCISPLLLLMAFADINQWKLDDAVPASTYTRTSIRPPGVGHGKGPPNRSRFRKGATP